MIDRSLVVLVGLSSVVFALSLRPGCFFVFLFLFFVLFLFSFLREDDQVFFRMLPDAPAQWILAFPMETAPRTLEGVFAGEVIEFVQVSARQRER